MANLPEIGRTFLNSYSPRFDIPPPPASSPSTLFYTHSIVFHQRRPAVQTNQLFQVTIRISVPSPNHDEFRRFSETSKDVTPPQRRLTPSSCGHEIPECLYFKKNKNKNQAIASCSVRRRKTPPFPPTFIPTFDSVPFYPRTVRRQLLLSSSP